MAGTVPLTHPGIQVDIKRSAVSAVSIGTSQAGIEARTIWHTTPRWRYQIRIIARAEANEATALSSLVSDNYVEGDTMDLTDPVDGSSQTVRWEGSPSFTQYRIPGWWLFEGTLISLV